VRMLCLSVLPYLRMPETKLEKEAREFLDRRDRDIEPEKLRKELITLLEWFIEQLKKKGA